MTIRTASLTDGRLAIMVPHKGEGYAWHFHRREWRQLCELIMRQNMRWKAFMFFELEELLDEIERVAA